jgi:hypothetical protein
MYSSIRKVCFPVMGDVGDDTLFKEPVTDDTDITPKIQRSEVRFQIKPMPYRRGTTPDTSLVLSYFITIISLLMSPLLGHRPSLWITHKECCE